MARSNVIHLSTLPEPNPAFDSVASHSVSRPYQTLYYTEAHAKVQDWHSQGHSKSAKGAIRGAVWRICLDPEDFGEMSGEMGIYAKAVILKHGVPIYTIKKRSTGKGVDLLYGFR